MIWVSTPPLLIPQVCRGVGLPLGGSKQVRFWELKGNVKWKRGLARRNGVRIHRPSALHTAENVGEGTSELSLRHLVSEREEVKAAVSRFLIARGFSTATASRTVKNSALFIIHLLIHLHSQRRARYLAGEELGTEDIHATLLPYLESLAGKYGNSTPDVIVSFPEVPSLWAEGDVLYGVTTDSSGEEKVIQNLVPPENERFSSRTLYLVDIHPLCYEGKRPRPTAVLKWMKLLFNQVTHGDPVIAVMDGEKGNDYRRQLLPGYKANRNKYKPLSGIRGPYYKGDEMDLREAFPLIQTFLEQCSVPVLKVTDAEADDVVATLMHQAVTKGLRVVVASPDMDFRQLLSESVNMLLPLPEFGRWSFYTLEQYISQNTCDPSLDLGLRCILGDASDNVPGLPDLAPGFGRKTALKLMKKHGSLESLLIAAKTRTVGRPYIQEALIQHMDVLYRNLQVLKLRRDVDITLKDEWCRRRDRSREVQAFQMLEKKLQGD